MIAHKNAYVCDHCASVIITIDRDVGTTPFMLACRYSGRKCPGMMQSRFYHISQQLSASHQWVKPSKSDMRRLRMNKNKPMLDHVNQGGLLLKPWSKPPMSEGSVTAFTKLWNETAETLLKKEHEDQDKSQAQAATLAGDQAAEPEDNANP